MAVGIKVGFYYYQIGNSDFLHAFFSNICYHLESKSWGSTYPNMMNKLYNGELKKEDVKKSLEELKEIRERLSNIHPSEVIWDIEDLTKKAPWGDNISNEITSLGNYFVTSEGVDLINHINIALEKAIEHNLDVKIKSI